MDRLRRFQILFLMLLPIVAFSGCMDLFHELRPSRLRRLNHGPAMSGGGHFSIADPVSTDGTPADVDDGAAPR